MENFDDFPCESDDIFECSSLCQITIDKMAKHYFTRLTWYMTANDPPELCCNVFLYEIMYKR